MRLTLAERQNMRELRASLDLSRTSSAFKEGRISKQSFITKSAKAGEPWAKEFLSWEWKQKKSLMKSKRSYIK